LAGKTLGEAILTGLVDPIGKEIKKGLGMVTSLRSAVASGVTAVGGAAVSGAVTIGTTAVNVVSDIFSFF
jgi:hypothetical protein